MDQRKSVVRHHVLKFTGNRVPGGLQGGDVAESRMNRLVATRFTVFGVVNPPGNAAGLARVFEQNQSSGRGELMLYDFAHALAAHIVCVVVLSFWRRFAAASIFVPLRDVARRRRPDRSRST